MGTSLKDTPTYCTLLLLEFADADGLRSGSGQDEFEAQKRQSDALFLECLVEYDGREIKDKGLGAYGAFEKPSDAVQCALTFQERLRELEIGIPPASRMAVHLSEWLEESDEPAAAGMQTAEQVMRLGVPGQILVTRSSFDSARDEIACAPDGSSLEWLAHGLYLLEGIDDPVDVYEVGVPGPSALERPAESDSAKRATALPDEPTLGWRPAKGLTVPGREAWLLQKKIGQGGFGEVWVAKEEETRELRAFKFCFKSERLRTLKREQTLFRLMQESLGDREDIARLFDVRLDEAPYYLELEYSPGGDLVDWVEQQGGLENIPMEQRLELIAHVAEALSAANSIGILHKDIKPRNVLIEEHEDGSIQPKLTDFGIGQLVSRDVLKDSGIAGSGFTTHASTAHTDIGSRTGTRIYMAPELLAGKAPSIQSDVYALGVMLYQIAAGDLTRPLGQGWQRDVKDDLLCEDIAACVDMDAERRLSGAGELAQRLRKLDERRSRRKADAEASEAAERNKRRRRLYFATSIAAATVAAIAGAFAFQQSSLRSEADEARAIAEEERAIAEEERGRAEREELAAKSVEEFLVDLFQISNPFGLPDPDEMKVLTEARGQTITAGEILDVGARKIENSLEEQPEVRARLMRTLATVYTYLALYDKALPLEEKALDIAREVYGEKSDEYADYLEGLGRVRLAMGDREQARTHFERVLHLRQELHDGDHEKVALSLHYLGKTYLTNELSDIAKVWCGKALEMERRLHTEDHVHVARALHHFGLSIVYQVEPAHAAPILREALAMHGRLPDEDSRAVAELLKLTGLLAGQKGDYAASVDYYRQALEVQRRVYGDKHPAVAGSLRSLAEGLVRAKNFAEAEPLYRESIDMVREILGDDHRQVADTIADLAGMQWENGELSAAEATYWEAIALGTNGTNGYRVSQSKLLRYEKKWEEARSVLTEGLDSPELNDKSRHDILNELASLHKEKGDMKSAENYLRQSLDMDPIHSATVSGIVSVLIDVDNLVGAEEVLRQAIEKAEKKLEPGHRRIGEFLAQLGGVLWRQGRFDAAEDMYRKAIPIVPDHRPGLAMLLLAKNEYDAAEEVARNHLAAKQLRAGENSIRLIDAYQLLTWVLLRKEDYGDLDEVFSSWSNIPLTSGPMINVENRYLLHLTFAAAVHQLRGDFVEAEKYWRGYLERLIEWKGEKYPSVARARHDLAIMLAAMGKEEELLGPRDGDPRGTAVFDIIQETRGATRPAETKDHTGYWRGTYSGADSMHLDVWGDGGLLTFVNSDFDSVWKFEVPVELLGSAIQRLVHRDYIAYGGPTSTENGVRRAPWRTDNGHLGKSLVTRVDPSEVKPIASADLNGSYRGKVGYRALFGFGDLEKVDILLNIECRGDAISGHMTLPLGRLEIVEGKFLTANRVFLDVRGSGVEGLMMGTASEDRLDFLYDIGFGTGEAHLTKTTPIVAQN